MADIVIWSKLWESKEIILCSVLVNSNRLLCSLPNLAISCADCLTRGQTDENDVICITLYYLEAIVVPPQ
jgi:hypothetical protein